LGPSSHSPYGSSGLLSGGSGSDFGGSSLSSPGSGSIVLSCGSIIFTPLFKEYFSIEQIKCTFIYVICLKKLVEYCRKIDLEMNIWKFKGR
jgi:hypothetical protein